MYSRNLDFHETLKEMIKAEVIYWEFGAEFGIGVCLLGQAVIMIHFCKSEHNKSILRYALEKLIESVIYMKKIKNMFGVAKCYELMYEVKQILKEPSFFEIQSFLRAFDEVKDPNYLKCNHPFLFLLIE